MSTLAFGSLMRKREEARAGESTRLHGSPGLSTFVDTLAALVPAEVLAAHEAILNATTETRNGVTRIADPTPLKVAFWALIAISALLYVVGFQKRARSWTARSWIGLAIPPLAFVAWTMGQKTSAFTAVFPDASQPMRSTILVLVAVVLSAVASLLPAAVDRANPKRVKAKRAAEAVPPVPPVPPVPQVQRVPPVPPVPPQPPKAPRDMSSDDAAAHEPAPGP